MIPLFLALMLAATPATVFAQEEPPAAEEEAPKPKKKAKKKEKAKPSRYKFSNPDAAPGRYRFDADGNPILPKKKTAKKPMSTPDDEIDGVVPAEDCTLTSDSCGEPKKD
jgi:hypothetical protein